MEDAKTHFAWTIENKILIQEAHTTVIKAKENATLITVSFLMLKLKHFAARKSMAT